MKSEQTAKSNRLSLIILVLGLILACILCSLPLYTFTAAVYTKKSSNTFVGDEKYQEVRAEVEQEAQAFREQGMDVEIRETVTERTNSKGKTTSLVAFSIEQTFRKNLWSFLTGSLASSRILLLMVIWMALALADALLGCRGCLDVVHRYLDKRKKRLRSTAGFLRKP